MINVLKEPFARFELWHKYALKNIKEVAFAMCFSTVSQDGQPSSRILLLKGFDERGFVFFTNSKSQKGRDLAINNKASMLFPWVILGRQIVIKGQVEELPQVETLEYFKTRPRLSQIGAVASKQSSVLESYKKFREDVAQVEDRFEGKQVEKPEEWKGYILKPSYFEFWRDGKFRLHKRDVYELKGDEFVFYNLYP